MTGSKVVQKSHARESGNPVSTPELTLELRVDDWMPAFAGMTFCIFATHLRKPIKSKATKDDHRPPSAVR